ncbi:MAG: M1 family aminopeptidase [Gammaproteobacteria bacterium]|nr:M1 family aminopeptidase [Gammaproteobacteria bacterium]
MFLSVYLFELRFQMRQPTFWVTAAIFFLLAFMGTANSDVQIGGSTSNLDINATFVIFQTMLVLSVFGMFVATAFCGNAVLRDKEVGIDGLLFSTRLNKFDYVFGRFFGAFTMVMLVMAVCMSGIFFGAMMPWLDPERIGALKPGAYAWTLFCLVLPTMLFCSAAFFSVANITRSLMGTYITVVVFLVLFVITQNLLSDPESMTLAAMLDPFALGAVGEATRYWTVFERNVELPALEGLFLANRLTWMGVSLLFLGLSYATFRFRTEDKQKPAKAKKKAADENEEAAPRHIPNVTQRFDFATTWQQFVMRTSFEVKAVAKSAPFFVILIVGLFNVLGRMSSMPDMYGTDNYLTTGLAVLAIQGSFLFTLVIIVVYYAGEIVWRERQTRISEIIEATPVPNGVLFVSKLLALIFVLVSLLTVAIICGLVMQTIHGYNNYELSVYLTEILLVDGWSFYLTAVLAIFLQVVSNGKWTGMLLLVAYIAVSGVMSSMGFEHNLYQYASAPGTPYSDINGYGHFLVPKFWFMAYWTVFAGILVLLGHLLWQRGTGSNWKGRLATARRKLLGPAGAALATLLVAFAGLGSFIFYNTNVLNEYTISDEREQLQADYEKTYGEYRDLLQLSTADVYAEVDIYPEERRFELLANITLQNRRDFAIDYLHLSIPDDIDIDALDIEGAELELDDERLGYRIYRFAEAVQPGESVRMTVRTSQTPRGFANAGNLKQVIENGTFFNNFEVLPNIGFADGRRLTDRSKRREHDLEPIDRMRPQDDPVGLAQNYLPGDWTTFEAVVSTSPDQIAIAPGYLQKEWIENDRRYFHYKMDSPMMSFYAFQSGRYAVHKDSWNDVAIEIYYHPAHDYNLDRMVEGVKDSLAYFSEHFGEYQHKQARIIEFPRYAAFAQAFPNTIPFSESIGFTADLSDPDDIDYVYYVTAHEMAHQWWAHQVMGADVKGATMLSETLSQYSALMVLEKEYGRTQMRRFLKYELDTYLQGRGGEVIEENPLITNENQAYIHYRKGSVVMYALREYLGEEVVNQALRNIVDEWKFRGPEWPTSQVLLAALKAEAPESEHGFIDDLINRITIWDLKLEEASLAETDNGRWSVELEIEAAKFDANGEGEETEVPLDMAIEIGLFGEEPEEPGKAAEPIYLERHQLVSGTNTLSITVDKRPASAGVDPYVRLIDRSSSDNLKTLSTD